MLSRCLALAILISVARLALAGDDPEGASAPIFVDRAAESGLEFVYFNGMSGDFFFPEIVGGGGALFDYDGDGDLDIYLVQGSMLGRDKGVDTALVKPQGELRDRLYRNDLSSEGPLRFTDVTASSGIAATGYGVGVAAADYDNDGWIDLYLTGFGPNQLLRNNGDGSFADTTAAAGVDDPRWSVPAVFFDFDRDGWLDLFSGSYVDYSVGTDKECRTLAGAPDYCGPLSYLPSPDRLWRNRGDGTFEDVSARAGILGDFGPALGAVAGDFNGDGWADLYVANDGMPNQMWMNRGNGTFVNESLLAGTAVNSLGRPEASMGVTVGDYDTDGDEDIFLTHLIRETNTVYRNDGRGFFEDATVEAGLGAPSWSFTGFGTSWIDYDNDGWLDLIVANGSVHVNDESNDGVFPLDETNQLFRNLGEGRFEEVTATAGAVFRLSEVSRGIATGDIDNDGDTDALVINNSGPVRLLINEVGNLNPWLGLRLVSGEPPHDSIGAWVGIERQGAPTLWRRASSSGSYISSSDPRVLVGLGSDAAVKSLVVRWPSGREEGFEVTAANRYLILTEGSGR